MDGQGNWGACQESEKRLKYKHMAYLNVSPCNFSKYEHTKSINIEKNVYKNHNVKGYSKIVLQPHPSTHYL